MKFQVFPENADIAPSKRVKFGIDPTFPRLHLGHLVPLRLVRQMMNQGHEVTIVLGTFTAQLGDPSGRDSTRPILSPIDVFNNADAILKTLERLLPSGFKVLRNADVFNVMNVASFMEMASKFTLAHMTSRDAFQKRIKEGNSIAMHELLVPLCQGWDSVFLHSEIEIGGQDQLFNFQIARQLQENGGMKPQACIMLPIINGTDGRKMSKSLGNCIFLDETPDEIFGKVMSIPDAVMEEWFPLFVDFTTDDKVHPMDKKKMLAVEIVNQLHSLGAAIAANDKFVKIIQNKESPADMPTVSAKTIIEAIVAIGGHSKTVARRLLREGAVQIDGVKTHHDADFAVSPGQVIKCGKRDFARIV